jgi:zinc transporter
VHLDADDPGAADWIAANLAYLPEPVRGALVAEGTRPRATVVGEGVLFNFRGVNLNPGAEPEDMISLRLYADRSRIVTLSRRPLVTVEEVAARFAAGRGPDDAGALVCDLVEGMTARTAEVITEMDLQVDLLEESALRGSGEDIRAEVTDLRAAVVDFRRYMVPQKAALGDLLATALPMIEEEDRVRLVEAREALTRVVEEIESQRERLIVVKDELASQYSDRLNRNLYILSVVSAVFLPLGFLTGLMGINLAGMPGASWPPAFWVFCGLLLLILVAQIVALSWLRIVPGGSFKRPRRGR